MARKGVQQGSVLGPLLSNIFLNDLFFFLMEETEICNHADDTIIYVCGQELERNFSSLENDAQRITEWIFDYSMKLNPDKCQLLIFGGKNIDVSVHIGETMVTESVEEKLDFKSHMNAMCKKAGQKLHALARNSRYMNFEKL